MKKLTVVLILSVLLISCKKATDTANSDLNIDLITGTYKGGTLTWEKWEKNSLTNKSSGNDFNVSFTATYSTNRIKINIITNAPISKKSFDLPMTFKQEMQQVAQVATSVYEFTDTSITYSLEKSFQYSASMTKIVNKIDVSGSLYYSYLTNPWSTYPTFEKFSLSGTKQ